VTSALIGLCCAAFLYRGYYTTDSAGLVPVDLMYAVLHPSTGLPVLLTLLLSFFVHAGLLHLVSNMWYLWVFGSALEYTIGTARFLLVYLLCGVLSMAAQAASTPYSTIPVVGASGAIAGVMGVFLVLLPLSRVLLWIPLVFFVRVPAFVFLVLWFGIQYLSVHYGPSSAGAGVAWWAHIGGYTAGLLLGLEIRRRRLIRRTGGGPGSARPRSRGKSGRR
jgi:membrane associated rhomboid family serine protease